jgi:hypothetical protein
VCLVLPKNLLTLCFGTKPSYSSGNSLDISVVYWMHALALTLSCSCSRIRKPISLHTNTQKAVEAIRSSFPHNTTRCYQSMRLMILELLPSTAVNRSSEINKPIANIYGLESGCNLHAIWHLYPKRQFGSLLRLSCFICCRSTHRNVKRLYFRTRNS